MTLVIIAVVLLTKIPIKMYVKGLKAIMFIILFTSVLNIFTAQVSLYGNGDFENNIKRNQQCNICFNKNCSTYFVSCVLTYTTSPTDLTDALERLMKPLTVFHIKVHEIAMMMTIALRFVPTLLEETDKIMSAQKARGANMDSGGLIKE